MSTTNLAISIVTFRRSELLDLCLLSVIKAIDKNPIPIYVIAQDPQSDDEAVLAKYSQWIREIKRTPSEDRDVEDLINSNRISAWEIALLENSHDFVVCLEDDVEVSEDFLDFTLAVIEQNSERSDFFGINYGSYETVPENQTYSRLRYGIHGPASLISRRSFNRFKINKLKKISGKIAWDSWVEPKTKTGFMATSNLARFRDNGINGTHTSASLDLAYFTRLSESFELLSRNTTENYKLSNISHSWRSDCVPYDSKENIKYQLKSLITSQYQLLKVRLRKLKVML